MHTKNESLHAKKNFGKNFFEYKVHLAEKQILSGAISKLLAIKKKLVIQFP